MRWGGKKNHSYWNYNWQARMFVSSFQAFQYNKTLFLYFLSLILSLSHLPLYVHIIQMRSAYQDRACGPDQTFHRGSILKKLRRFDATFLQIFRCKKGYVQTHILKHTPSYSLHWDQATCSLSQCLLSLIYPIINSSLTLIHNYGCFKGEQRAAIRLECI